MIEDFKYFTADFCIFSKNEEYKKKYFCTKQTLIIVFY